MSEPTATSGAELLREELSAELDAMGEAGTLKTIQVLESPQGPEVELRGRGRAVVLSSNDYLGLAAHPDVIAAGHAALDRYGAGTASVRFICGLFAPASRARGRPRLVPRHRGGAHLYLLLERQPRGA